MTMEECLTVEELTKNENEQSTLTANVLSPIL